MSLSLRSLLFFNFGSPLSKSSGTFQSCPSFGKHAKTFLENGLYSTSCSSSKASCSASLSSISPKVLTKCPLGNLEFAFQLSIATTILLPINSFARLVLILTLGKDLSIKITKTFFAALLTASSFLTEFGDN